MIITEKVVIERRNIIFKQFFTQNVQFMATVSYQAFRKKINHLYRMQNYLMLKKLYY